MKALFAFLLAFAWTANAAISTATKPHTIDSAATPKVSYVDDNDEALLDKINEVIDTVNLHNSSGAVVGDVFSSTGDMRLLIDSDNNGTNRWMVTANGATDTLWRILESGAWKGFGDGYVAGKVVASDSLVGATVRATGNLSAGGTLAVTGASTIAALSATTGSFSSTLGVTGASTLAALSATTGSFSSTLGVTGASTLAALSATTGTFSGALSTAAHISFDGYGTTGTSRIYRTAADGLVMRGNTGSSNDLVLEAADGNDILRNPTGTTQVTFPASGGVTVTNSLTSGALSATTGSFSSNLTQSAGVTTISVTDNTANAVDIQEGSANYINVNTTNSSENVSIGNATTNPTVSLLGTGTKTIDGTINTDLTASRTVVTDGSGNLSVNTETGTGSHVKATSPTLVTPTLGVASATSMALGGGEAFVYGDTSFTLTATGMTTSPTGTAHASRIGRIVTIQLPFITGTSNATSFTLTGVPSDYRPSTFDQEVAVTLYQNNGTQESGGYCTVTTGGSITITRRDGALWTNSGTKSVNPANITFIAR